MTALSEQAAAEKLTVYLLGRFEIVLGTRTIRSEHWRSVKACNLFKILLARRGFQLTRHEAAEALWPELDASRAANNLHQAVRNLRLTLEPELERASQSLYLRSEGNWLRLNSALIAQIDLEEFRQLHRQAQLSDDLSLYERAAAMYTGDYLPEDLYEDWSVSLRESLRQEWTELLLKLAELYQTQEQPEKYLMCLRRLLESNFLHEEVVQRLMRALAEAGRRDEALNLYRNFNGRLQSRLGLEPLAKTRHLQQEIALGRIAPGTKPLFVREPAPATLVIDPVERIVSRFEAGDWHKRLVGRKKEIEAWQQRLEEIRQGRGGLSLVLGEAGIGKTSLLKEMTRWAELSGLEVVQAACCREQAALPYSALLELLEKALNRLNPVEQAEARQLCGPELRRLLTGLPPQLSYPDTSDPATQQLFLEATRLAVWLEGKRRWLFVLDDLHYLSDQGARLLGYLLTHPALSSLTVLAALRPVDTELGLGRLIIQQTTKTPSSLYRLKRLERNELGELLARQLGQAPEARLVELVQQLSQGNPHLSLELLAAWQREGVLRQVRREWRVMSAQWDGKLPAVVISYIRHHLSDLSGQARALLELAAQIGQKFTFELIRQIVLHRLDGAGWQIKLDRAGLGPALTELVSQGWIEEQDIHYCFAYPLLVETLNAGLPYAQRQCWNEVVVWAKTQLDSRLLVSKEGQPDARS